MTASPNTSNTPPLARSKAFRLASLRSEQHRDLALLATAGLIGVMSLVFWLSGMIERDFAQVAWVASGCLAAVQVCMLSLVRWSRRSDRDLPTALIAACVLVECLIPSLMMLWHVEHRLVPPYSALMSPPVVGYALVIVLTILRLRPVLCVLAGVACAGGYLCVVLRVRYGLGLESPTTGLPITSYYSIGVLLLIGGLAAAWVTRETRRHLEAALNEAEMRHQVARLEHDLSVARTIQRALLPRSSPDLAGFEIAGWNRSADQTGGDYYDWHSLPDGRWIVTLADVSGHGIGPALVTTACRAYIRAGCSHDGDVASLASRTNRLLADDLPEGRFVTMAAVLIDPATGRLDLLSAGHGPIVLYARATRASQEIMPQDMPLAVMPDSTFGPAVPLELGPGDVLALVTDGFVEWSRPESPGRKEQFGMDRLRASLERHAELPAEELIAAVAADVAEFARGEPQQDDLTMVVIKRVGV